MGDTQSDITSERFGCTHSRGESHNVPCPQCTMHDADTTPRIIREWMDAGHRSELQRPIGWAEKTSGIRCYWERAKTEPHQVNQCLVCLEDDSDTPNHGFLRSHGEGTSFCGPWQICKPCARRLSEQCDRRGATSSSDFHLRQICCPICGMKLGSMRRAFVATACV